MATTERCHSESGRLQRGPKPLEKILGILFLRDETPFPHLLDLKTKKECKLSNCRVHKPGVPRGPASTLGLGPGEQHVVHGPAQKSKNTTGQKDSPVADRKVFPKERMPTRQLLRPTSPTGALASDTSRLQAVSPIGRPGPTLLPTSTPCLRSGTP